MRQAKEARDDRHPDPCCDVAGDRPLGDAIEQEHDSGDQEEVFTHETVSFPCSELDAAAEPKEARRVEHHCSRPKKRLDLRLQPARYVRRPKAHIASASPT